MAFQDRCSLHQFQSTHPSGVRHVGKHVVVGVVISIHAPQWGATTQGLLMASPALFQSTHPSGVRQTVLVQFYDLLVISIHAPQWGATIRPKTVATPPQIFQSTHPSGVRPQCHGTMYRAGISIHAPQWGATLRPVLHTVHGRISIHAPQWGATWS